MGAAASRSRGGLSESSSISGENGAAAARTARSMRAISSAEPRPGRGRTPSSTTQRSGTTLIAAPPWTVPTLRGTKGTPLFGIGEDQGQGGAPVFCPGFGREVGGHGQDPLHVAGAAGHPVVAGVGEGERVALPLFFFGGDDVHVAREHEPPPVPRGL